MGKVPQMADRSDELRTPSPPFRVGDWLVEPAQDTIRCGESLRHLEPKVMDALVATRTEAGGASKAP